MLENFTNAVVVLVTTGNHDEAVRLSDMLVGSRLAACVQILPQIESIYRWKDKINRDSEFLLIIKTSRERLESLETSIRAIHSYEMPEIVALPVSGGSAPYLQWLMESVNSNSLVQGSTSDSIDT